MIPKLYLQWVVCQPNCGKSYSVIGKLSYFTNKWKAALNNLTFLDSLWGSYKWTSNLRCSSENVVVSSWCLIFALMARSQSGFHQVEWLKQHVVFVLKAVICSTTIINLKSITAFPSKNTDVKTIKSNDQRNRIWGFTLSFSFYIWQFFMTSCEISFYFSVYLWKYKQKQLHLNHKVNLKRAEMMLILHIDMQCFVFEDLFWPWNRIWVSQLWVSGL